MAALLPRLRQVRGLGCPGIRLLASARGCVLYNGSPALWAAEPGQPAYEVFRGLKWTLQEAEWLFWAVAMGFGDCPCSLNSKPDAPTSQGGHMGAGRQSPPFWG